MKCTVHYIYIYVQEILRDEVYCTLYYIYVQEILRDEVCCTQYIYIYVQ